MRGVGRAAAVAAHQQLVAGGQAEENHFRRAAQRFIQARQSAKRRDGIFNRTLQLCHAGRLVVGH
jgi:cytochrome c5